MKLNSLKMLVVAVFTSTLIVSCSQEPTETVVNKSTPAEAISDPDIIPGQYIVVFNTNVTGNEAKAMANYSKSQELVKSKTALMIQDAGINAEILSVYSKTINGALLKMDAKQADMLSKRKEVSYVEKDRLVVLAPPCGTPMNPCSGGGGGTGGSSGQQKPYGITRVNGGATYTGSHVAWIIDTGIDLDHEDLNVDASRGFNAFTSGRDSKSLDDGNGHGTHVSGTIAAIDNGVGVVGVAAGATVIPVKVLDSRGSGSYSGVIAGVDWVAGNGNSGDVANMSLGGPVSDALDQAVKDAAATGVKFALAAGNETDDANNHSPARANGTNIYTISAMDNKDVYAYFSNYGNPPIDYCAPGVNILSCWKDGGYNTISGTSMAAPHAAGVLLWGNPSSDGTVSGDPDGTKNGGVGYADPIIYHQ
ncbi:peptidase S8 [Christiangramia fulva]|uniref:Peptidase S8 n=1 Tax=Christiangramia fulva TaxID=2126553 RepID=A0A2R3Z187_9FLAO|nr:S8 family serine peptidase [Christiangramia fulva]AVR44005.1 peptidase S8 [Christiangramia fulva]